MTTLQVDPSDKYIVIDAERIPVCSVYREDISLGSHEHRTRGVRILTENGMTISVVWGNYTYGSNYVVNTDEWTEEPSCVEVAVWPIGDEMLRWRDPADAEDEWFDSLLPYLSVEELPALVRHVATLPSDYRGVITWPLVQGGSLEPSK